MDHTEPMVFSVNRAGNYLEVLACLRNHTGSLGSVPANGGITLPGARKTEKRQKPVAKKPLKSATCSSWSSSCLKLPS